MAIDWATFRRRRGPPPRRSAPRRGAGPALEHALREAIRSGRLAPGTRLPSTRALAAELGLARGTVTAAYDQLVAEGYLSARTGSGTTVAAPARRRRPAPTPNPRRRRRRPGYDLRPRQPGRDDASRSRAWLRGGAAGARSGAPSSALRLRRPARPASNCAPRWPGTSARTRGVLAEPGPDRRSPRGYVAGAGLLGRALRGRRTGVAMEDPGTRLPPRVVRRAGLRGLPLAGGRRGAPDRPVRTGRADRAAVLTPAHQYPTGVTLHPTRRHAAHRLGRGARRR